MKRMNLRKIIVIGISFSLLVGFTGCQESVKTDQPTVTVSMKEESILTATPVPTVTPVPTATPEPTVAPEPEDPDATPASAFKYTIANGQVTIDGLNDNSLTSISIPKRIEGYPVTTIGNCAFSWCFQLTNVELPEGILNINPAAFESCYSLSSVTIPNTVKYIGEAAFKSSAIRSIDLPDNITVIEDETFSGCGSLSSIIIPEGVTRIGEDAFNGIYALEEVSIPSSVVEIGPNAFSNTPWINEQFDTKGYFAVNGMLLKAYVDGDFVIPNSVTKICDLAFYNNSDMTSIEIPNSVTSIGNAVFVECSSLNSIIVTKGSFAEQWAIDNGYENKLVVK